MDDGNFTKNLLSNDNSSNHLNFSGILNSNQSDDPSSDVTASDLQSEKVYWALMMVPLPLMAVVGNVLVILSVCRERSLQSATNYFIVSLAFADLLVAAVVMPFAVYVLVNVDWELSETLCDFYIALDVTCSTASIFNLVAISIDRFIAVTQPIKYSKHKNSKRVLLTIVSVWLVSAAIGSPIVLGLNTSPERIPNLCVFYNSDFIIYSSLSSFYIPCIAMIFLYYRIFKAIRARARKAVAQKQSATPHKDQHEPNTNNQSRSRLTSVDPRQKLVPLLEADETSHMLPIDGAAVAACDADHNEVRLLHSDEEQSCLKAHSAPVEQAVLAESRLEDNDLRNLQLKEPSRVAVLTSTICFKVNGSASPGQAKDEHVQEKDDQQVARSLFGLAKKHRRKAGEKKRERNAARRERKATKTLAIVLGVFLVCWVPFFTCNIMDAICIKVQSDTWRPGVTAFLLTTWLGYLNSCVNPLIYTVFNVEFRKAFKKLLLQPCKR